MGVVAAILCGCVHGLLLSVTMRLLSNIVIVYAHAVSMLCVTLISVLCFDLRLSFINLFGILLVAFSITSYHGEQKPDIPQSIPSHEEKICLLHDLSQGQDYTESYNYGCAEG